MCETERERKGGEAIKKKSATTFEVLHLCWRTVLTRLVGSTRTFGPLPVEEPLVVASSAPAAGAHARLGVARRLQRRPGNPAQRRLRLPQAPAHPACSTT